MQLLSAEYLTYNSHANNCLDGKISSPLKTGGLQIGGWGRVQYLGTLGSIRSAQAWVPHNCLSLAIVGSIPLGAPVNLLRLSGSFLTTNHSFQNAPY